ncbi:MAG: hypothetical protein ABWZ01_03885 [Methyloceanibacter sp.]
MRYRLIDALEPSHIEELVSLYQNKWWSKGRTREDVRKMLAHSDIVFRLVEAEADRLVGFARAITDRVYRGTVYDVIVAVTDAAATSASCSWTRSPRTPTSLRSRASNCIAYRSSRRSMRNGALRITRPAPARCGGEGRASR